MNRLSGDIGTTRNERVDFVDSLRHNVNGMLTQFHNDHSMMSKGLNTKAKDLNSSLSEFIRNLSDSTSRSLKDFHERHKQMAKEQNEFLGENRKQRQADIDRMISMFRKERQEMRKGLQEMAKELRGNLNNFAQDLKNTVADMRKELSEDYYGASMAWKKMSSAKSSRRKRMNSNVESKSGTKVEEKVEEKVEAEVEEKIEAASPKSFSIKQETPIDRIKGRFKSKKNG